jgi:putative DNA primase/helicase
LSKFTYEDLEEAERRFEERRRPKQSDIPPDDEDVSRPIKYADESLALHFTSRHVHNLRFVNVWGRWLIWNGQRWLADETLRAFDLARAIAREASAEIVDGKGSPRLASTVASAKTVAAIERLARADRRHASGTEDWDADPWLLNTPGGTVDLRTGTLRSHSRADLITKMTAVAPNGSCRLWLAFLDRGVSRTTRCVFGIMRPRMNCEPRLCIVSAF